MARLLLIETSTVLCSTAICDGPRVISYRENAQREHSSLTAQFIHEMLEETGLKVRDLDAVSVSRGPGSYTGLRVGSSTAKGLCFGGGIPLLSVSSPEVLLGEATGEERASHRYIVPMIDARRMEVYTAVFRSSDGKMVSPIESKVIDEGSFADILSEGDVLFLGDGALKCREAIKSANAHFRQCFPSARGMVGASLLAFSEGRTEDTAYFEPFYLKEFKTTVSRKKLF